MSKSKSDGRRFSAQPLTIQRDVRNLVIKLGATSLRISSPDLLDPKDVKASITWDRAAKRYISACSRWNNYADNLRAAYWAIEYTWRIAEAYGVAIEEEDLMTTIFAALEAPLDPNILLLGDGAEEWWRVLGVDPRATKAAIVNAFRALSKVHHPDVGGDPDNFIKLKRAYEEGVANAK